MLTEKLEKVIHPLEWVRVEEFIESMRYGVGRVPHARAWLANAFVAKAVLEFSTTVGLIERGRTRRAWFPHAVLPFARAHLPSVFSVFSVKRPSSITRTASPSMTFPTPAWLR